MPKNVKKRKKGTRVQHKDTPFANPNEGLYYAVIDKRCGGSFVDALCSDGKIRKIYLRGAVRKRVWLNPGDAVLISLREELSDNGKCDIIIKYRPDVSRQLQKQGALKFSKDHQPDSCLDSGTSEVVAPIERPTMESMMPPMDSDEYDDEVEENENAVENIDDADTKNNDEKEDGNNQDEEGCEEEDGCEDGGDDDSGEGSEDEDGSDDEEGSEDENSKDRWSGKNIIKKKKFKNVKSRRAKGRTGAGKAKKGGGGGGLNIDAI